MGISTIKMYDKGGSIMNFGDRIKQLRVANNLSQTEFGKMIGVAKTTVSSYERNNSVPNDEIKKEISRKFNVSIDELVGNDVKIKQRSFKIPVFAYVSAGNPLFTSEEIIDWEELPIKYKSQGEFFALMVKGQSMEPRFCEGDVVIVKKQNDVDDGELAIVLVNGDQATFKQVRKSDAGITLIGTNTAAYLPHFYSNDEIETLPVAIIGKVVEARIKF